MNGLQIIGSKFLKASAAAALTAATVAMPLNADVLELKDGTVLDGMYVGGSQSSMRFRVDNDVQVIPIGKILALTITGRSAANATPGSGVGFTDKNRWIACRYAATG